MRSCLISLAGISLPVLRDGPQPMLRRCPARFTIRRGGTQKAQRESLIRRFSCHHHTNPPCITIALRSRNHKNPAGFSKESDAGRRRWRKKAQGNALADYGGPSNPAIVSGIPLLCVSNGVSIELNRRFRSCRPDAYRQFRSAAGAARPFNRFTGNLLLPSFPWIAVLRQADSTCPTGRTMMRFGNSGRTPRREGKW